MVPRRCGIRLGARALGRAAPAVARHRARRFCDARPAQMAIDAARERLRRRPRSPVPLRQLRRHRRVRPRRGGARPRRQPWLHGAAVQPGLRRAQGLGFAARTRAKGVRPPHRARHRADAVPRGSGRGASGVRPPLERPVDLLLPLPPVRNGRRGAARPAERATAERAAAGRPRLPVECDPGRPLLPAHVHRQLPHRGRGSRSRARGGRRAGARVQAGLSSTLPS